MHFASSAPARRAIMVERLQANGVLIDGEGAVALGERNFRALFEGIEEDQIGRGVLRVEARHARA